jgi:hypothetical protein
MRAYVEVVMQGVIGKPDTPSPRTKVVQRKTTTKYTVQMDHYFVGGMVDILQEINLDMAKARILTEDKVISARVYITQDDPKGATDLGEHRRREQTLEKLSKRSYHAFETYNLRMVHEPSYTPKLELADPDLRAREVPYFIALMGRFCARSMGKLPFTEFPLSPYDFCQALGITHDAKKGSKSARVLSAWLAAREMKTKVKLQEKTK